MSPSTVYLVSGANRGIGLGLVNAILMKHDTCFIYAGVRDPANATALNELKEKYPEKLAVVKLVSADVEGSIAVAKEIEQCHGRVDTPGIGHVTSPTAEVDPATVDEHFKVNVTGTIVLFQALYSLLKKSKAPKFVPVSSDGGCLDGFVVKSAIGGPSYGASKAALNWVTRKIHFENEWLVAFPLSPGQVDTDMLHNGADADTTGTIKNMIKANASMQTVGGASARILDLVDGSTRDREGGEFVHVDGTHLPW